MRGYQRLRVLFVFLIGRTKGDRNTVVTSVPSHHQGRSYHINGTACFYDFSHNHLDTGRSTEGRSIGFVRDQSAPTDGRMIVFICIKAEVGNFVWAMPGQ
jgi:hypothetical protein